MRKMTVIVSLWAVLASATGVAAPARDIIALTVYMGGRGVVTEQRAVSLAPGRQRLAVDAVAPRLLPETLDLSRPGLRVLSQRVRDQPVSHAALLAHFLGETVWLVPRDDVDATPRNAVLMGADPAAPVVRLDDRLVVLDQDGPWRIVFPSRPDAWTTAPRILAEVVRERATQAPLTVSYLTEGLSWRLDYLARLDADAGELVLTGFASIDNRSGIGYPGARIRLVAGEPNRVTNPSRPVMLRAAMAESKASAYAGPEQAFEYYTYSLARPQSLPDRATVQVPLIDGRTLAVEREYRIDSTENARPYGGVEADAPIHAQVILHARNTTKQPLPGGIVRLFASAEAGAEGGGRIWLGEDRLPPVPAGQTLTLTAGRAFDVTAVREQVDAQQIGKDRWSASWRIEVRNAREQAVTVRVVETMPGDWRIEQESARHEPVDAQAVAWTLRVPAGGSQALTYQVSWR